MLKSYYKKQQNVYYNMLDLWINIQKEILNNNKNNIINKIHRWCKIKLII